MSAVWILALALTASAGAKKDSDGDGVIDKEDLCKNAAEDLDGFEDADGCPEVDNDRDDVIDEMDQCPLEAEDKDGYQDKDGCPETEDEQGAAAAAPNLPMKAMEAFDQALKAGDAAAAQGLFHETGWSGNLMGSTGIPGERLTAQAIAESLAVQPLERTLEAVGERHMVWCKILEREDETEIDAVYVVLAPADGGWKLLAVGKDEFDARNLAEEKAEPDK